MKDVLCTGIVCEKDEVCCEYDVVELSVHRNVWREVGGGIKVQEE